MSTYYIPLLWMVIFYLPAVVLVSCLVLRKRKRLAQARLPFTNKPLRLAGESTREKADALWSSTSEGMLFIIAGLPILGFICALVPTPNRLVTCGTGFVAACAIAFFVGRRLMRDLSASWDYRLGALGEQVVGRELDKLIARDCQVFHDVPFDGWNIDHIVVSPVGVFAVETKTWRKPPKGGEVEPEVIFDGSTLMRPGNYLDRAPLDQAARNARTLSKWIADAAGEQVTVVPVVALPGWRLRITRYGDVAVYSATNMGFNMLKRGNTQLSAAQIQRIAFPIAKKCGLEDI